MAILIVDDESSTRNALRDLLTQLGHKTILEAKNGEEGLKVADAEKNRLRMIVADWEMPYLDGITMMERMALLPELDLAPFLLITSDLPRTRLAELQAKTDRLDAFLIKPFRMSVLAQAMDSAQAHRASLRRKIVALSASGALPARLQEAFAGPKSETSKEWDVPVVCRTLAEFQQAVQTHARRLGALCLNPEGTSPLGPLAQWLESFVRTPLGAATPVICASRDPALIFPLRTLCEAFVAPDGDWAAHWAALRRKEAASLTLELLFQELKTELQKKKTVEAGKLCEKILTLDQTSSEAHATLGDLLDSQGNREAAIAHYWSALEINPCQPKPYIRLLEGAKAATPALAKAATAAAAHCPQNPDVLFSAARAWLTAGDAAKAQALAQTILTLNPKHAGAQGLLKPAP